MPPGLALMGMPRRNRNRTARHRFCQAVLSSGAAPKRSSTKANRSISARRRRILKLSFTLVSLIPGASLRPKGK
eukprot:4743517-Pyramimonas_sp.AAC.1